MRVALLAMICAGCVAEVDVNVRIVEVERLAPAVPSRLLAPPAASNPTGYAYAAVDGLKLQLQQIRGADMLEDRVLTRIELDRELELNSDPEQRVVLDEVVPWVVGRYRGVTAIVRNQWELKAHCRTRVVSDTEYTHVYTTASGTATRACPGTDGCIGMPADYDYLPPRFVMADDQLTDPALATSESFYLETNFDYEIEELSTPTVSLLFDGSFTVACWDGVGWSDSDRLDPFAGPHPDARELWFPDGAATFAGGYPMLFGHLAIDPTAADPTAETYAVTHRDDPTLVDPAGGGFDLRTLNIVTILSDSSGPIAGRTRNRQPHQLGNVLSDLEGFTVSSNGGWDLFSSEWYFQGAGLPNIYVRNWQLLDFDPTPDGSTFSTGVVAGPDCGGTFLDQRGNNAAHPCQGEFSDQPLPRTIHWHALQ